MKRIINLKDESVLDLFVLNTEFIKNDEVDVRAIAKSLVDRGLTLQTIERNDVLGARKLNVDLYAQEVITDHALAQAMNDKDGIEALMQAFNHKDRSRSFIGYIVNGGLEKFLKTSKYLVHTDAEGNVYKGLPIVDQAVLDAIREEARKLIG